MTEPQTLPDTAAAAPRGATGDAAVGRFALVDREAAMLWHNYALARDKGPLLLHYSSLVSCVASSVSTKLPSSVEMADLVSYGLFGLADAIDKFEPGRGVTFRTYASRRIRGAILDELRSMDWVPRSVQSKIREVERAYAALQMRLSRTPTESEVAAELHITVADLRRLSSEIALAHVVLVDDVWYSAGFDHVTFPAAFSCSSRRLTSGWATCWSSSVSSASVSSSRRWPCNCTFRLPTCASTARSRPRSPCCRTRWPEACARSRCASRTGPSR